MPGCCRPDEYDSVFPSSYARRKARQYQDAGLDDMAARLVDFLVEQGLTGSSVLEVGGGVGGLHLELLRRGAVRATNLELSRSYDAEAARLIAAAGVGGRVDRRIVDLAADPTAVEDADLVVLHRVVCCYPDFRSLLGAAADRSRRALVLSYPRPRALTRAQTALENVGYAVRRRGFRTFVHAPEQMERVLAEHGHQVVRTGRNRMWQFTGTVRTT